MLVAPAAVAQEPGSEPWTIPELLFEDQNGFSRLDYLATDPAGVVHCFWAHNPNSPYDQAAIYDENQTAIYYRKWYQEEWSDARDILLRSSATMPFGLAVDGSGWVHLVTSVGGPPCLGYLGAPVGQLQDPSAWLNPKCVEYIGVGSPDLAIDSEGVLYAVYVEPSQQGLNLVRSEGGARWSLPIEVARVSGGDVFVAYPRFVVDAANRLHVVWGEVTAPDGYPWRRILYSHSLDGGNSWSEPVALADEHQGDPNLTVYKDRVHVVWNGDAGYQGRYYRSSDDGGATWSSRVTLPLENTSGGLQGAPAIVADATGTVHILYTDSPTLHYITRRGEIWSDPMQIAGPENTGATREINYPMLGITGGNQLHALYTRDAEAVYYQSLPIDAPPKASVPWPDPVVVEPAKETPLVTIEPTPTPQPTAPGAVAPPLELGVQADRSTIAPALGGALAALLLVLGASVLYLVRMRR